MLGHENAMDSVRSPTIQAVMRLISTQVGDHWGIPAVVRFAFCVLLWAHT